VLAESTPILRLIVLTAVLTGARKNEVLSLTWDRVDFDAGTLRIESRKRTHALPAELWQPLLDHHTLSPYNVPDDFVFATSTGSPIDGRNALRWFKEAAERAGITRRVWIHQLRHTAGTRAAEVGLTALEVAAMLGHAQASTSERYIHLAINRRRRRRRIVRFLLTSAGIKNPRRGRLRGALELFTPER
jgi:integrase